MGYAVLQLLSKYVRFGRRILLFFLMGVEEAKIKLLMDDMIRIFREVIQTKYPTVQHFWGSMDGVKLQIEKPGDDVVQSHFYNGWTHSHYVANLFLFTPNGCICDAYINSRGQHMTQQWRHIEKNVLKNRRFNGTAKVVVNSAFALEEWDSLIKSYQNVEGREDCGRITKSTMK